MFAAMATSAAAAGDEDMKDAEDGRNYGEEQEEDENEQRRTVTLSLDTVQLTARSLTNVRHYAATLLFLASAHQLLKNSQATHIHYGSPYLPHHLRRRVAMARLTDERVAKTAGPTGQNGVSEIFIATASVGAVLIVAGVVLVICFLNRRQNQKRGYHRQSLWPEFMSEKETRPVVSSKTSAGPGGLKNSPSPILSPENPDLESGKQRDQLQKQQRNVKDVASDIRKMARTASIPRSVTPVEVQPKIGAGVGGGQVTLQKQIFDKAFAAMVTAKSGDLDDVDGNGNGTKQQGILHFSLSYSFEKNALTVNILRCTNLPNKCINANHLQHQLPDQTTAVKKLIDPYIKLQLLPEKQHKIQTRVVRNTTNPVYDEEFVFYGMNYAQIQNTTLHFVIVSFDRYLRDEIIGEVFCPLNTVDLQNSTRTVDMNMNLVESYLKFQNQVIRGDLLVSICLQNTSSKINVIILKARNLPKSDITGVADPYVKIYFIFNDKTIAKKKTRVKKRSLEPVFNESFVFDVPPTDMALMNCISFEFWVVDWDRITKNEVMGRMEIGYRAKTYKGRTHWEDVCRNPRKQIAEWHRLWP